MGLLERKPTRAAYSSGTYANLIQSFHRASCGELSGVGRYEKDENEKTEGGEGFCSMYIEEKKKELPKGGYTSWDTHNASFWSRRTYRLSSCCFWHIGRLYCFCLPAEQHTVSPFSSSTSTTTTENQTSPSLPTLHRRYPSINTDSSCDKLQRYRSSFS